MGAIGGGCASEVLLEEACSSWKDSSSSSENRLGLNVGSGPVRSFKRIWLNDIPFGLIERPTRWNVVSQLRHHQSHLSWLQVQQRRSISNLTQVGRHRISQSVKLEFRAPDIGRYFDQPRVLQTDTSCDTGGHANRFAIPWDSKGSLNFVTSRDFLRRLEVQRVPLNYTREIFIWDIFIEIPYLR